MTAGASMASASAERGSTWRRAMLHVRDRLHAWLRWLLLILLSSIAALLAMAWLNSPPWPYSLVADTEYAMLKPIPTIDTQWSVDGATVCMLRSAAQPEDGSSDASRTCGSPRWIEVRTNPDAELSLVLKAAATDAAYGARFSLAESGGLALHVSADGAGSGLTLVGSGGSTQALGKEALVRFTAADAGEWPRRLVFPFTGSAFIGEDARASGAAILRDGALSIYAQADEAVSGRAVIDGVALVPGDRVELASVIGSAAHPRGFIHVDLLVPKPDAHMSGMQVVAFGQSEALRIVRFGEQGVTFKPGIWARLTRHSLMNTWIALLAAMFGTLLAVIPLCDSLQVNKGATAGDGVRNKPGSRPASAA